MLIHRFLLPTLAGLLSLSTAVSPETQTAIEKGRQRLESIPDPAEQTDSQVKCDFDAYLHRPRTPNPEAWVKELTDAVAAPVAAPWQEIDVTWPPETAPDDAPIKFFCYYNPDGAIVYVNIERKGPDPEGPPYSAADVSWTNYKRVVNESGGPRDYTKIKYIIHAIVESEGSDVVFEDIAVPNNGDISTFTDPRSDGFLALLGLSNGATVTSLLRFHNQEMGGKRIQSVKAWLDSDGQQTLMWVLG